MAKASCLWLCVGVVVFLSACGGDGALTAQVTFPNTPSPIYPSATTPTAGQPFGYGFFADDDLHLSGIVTVDAFDSTAGSYARTSGLRALVGANASVYLSGVVSVDGDVRAGGTVPNRGGAVSITGAARGGEGLYALGDPAVVVAAAAALNDNSSIPLSAGGQQALVGTALNLTANDTLSVPGGTYYFTSVTLTSATLQTSGTVRFYVDGPVTMTSTRVFNTRAKADQFVVISDGSELELELTSDAYWAVYAPGALVVLDGRSRWYGALVARELWVPGVIDLHHDLGLATLSVP